MKAGWSSSLRPEGILRDTSASRRESVLSGMMVRFDRTSIVANGSALVAPSSFLQSTSNLAIRYDGRLFAPASSTPAVVVDRRNNAQLSRETTPRSATQRQRRNQSMGTLFSPTVPHHVDTSFVETCINGSLPLQPYCDMLRRVVRNGNCFSASARQQSREPERRIRRNWNGKLNVAARLRQTLNLIAGCSSCDGVVYLVPLQRILRR